MNRTILYNAKIVSDDRITPGCVIVAGRFIESIIPYPDLPASGPGSLSSLIAGADRAIDCEGGLLMPGVIDTHVHFRDPGLTEKADIGTESCAAIAGGVTSFIDMPNTKPPTVTRSEVENKINRAAQVSHANYGFFIGATNDNLSELLTADYSRIAGIKLFLGSSTGNMLVDSDDTLTRLFSDTDAIIAIHAEDEATIAQARKRLIEECGGTVPVNRHPDLRPREACIAATRRAIRLAENSGAHIHICHISTAEELSLIDEARLRGVNITAETCPQYLLFDRNDFSSLGARIKCNPSIKDPSDRIALMRALISGSIDTIATDHAPHLLSQKEGDALTAASGMPMIQFSLLAMLELADTDPSLEQLTPAHIARLMSHNPATIFSIDRRGFIRPGYFADLVLVSDLPAPRKITDSDVLSRCAWTPLTGFPLSRKISLTMLGGEIAYRDGEFLPATPSPLSFSPQLRHKAAPTA